ncbi:menaquinone biosynthetic enzyme MqnA/MqnD family protein [Desulfosediminicola ganghwensis]|uniref:menaquinone biosynthetic enzyme MqnA/MqnD family protein n=1 Tax=Desulfosediminicola ganghwensis TaxID=2569540 RepID=UPI0010AC41C8|nr:menaquinone biosynthesis protein [Desulfosediminicola ganghwensis]
MNKQVTSDIVRIGMVNYINVAPIYEPWKRREAEVGWNVVEAIPSKLNRMLAEGELDLGFVSCYEYGAHPELYRILPDLSISANGPVGSVFLFSRVPVKKLDGQRVLLTSQSETSVSLTKVALEEFFNVQPEYVTGEVMSELRDECAAVLAIGDDALRLTQEGNFSHQLDLGEVWKKNTGLPFVFAVCAVREEFCQQNPLLLSMVHKRLLECRSEGNSRLDDICKIAAPKIPMEVDRCKAYLKGIQYDLDEKKREALEQFFSYLIKRGDASPGALPLKVHSFT